MTADPLAVADTWAAAHVAVGVVDARGVVVASRGPADHVFPLASVTKLVTAVAVLVAVEEGTVSLDDRAGPVGSTVRHLLAHASGLGPEGEAMAAPERRRIYSNAGFDTLGAHLAERADMTFAGYASEAVAGPLGLTGMRLGGRPAAGAEGTLSDLLALGAEFLAPTLLAQATMAEATTVVFPGLSGVLPGFGRHDPNDWGLGFELAAGKSPHWTGRRNSPGTFGHFGASGTFLWVDPVAGLACACLTDRPFGPWAAQAWPLLSDAILDAYAGQ